MRNGRQEQYNHKYGLAYGRDHAMGLFVQVWKLDPSKPSRAYENMPDGDNIIVDSDQFQKPTLTIKEIVETTLQYGFDLSAELDPDETAVEYD